MGEIALTDFKGIRNDRGQKFTDPKYFFNTSNFNYDDLIGANKILMPSIALNLSAAYSVDGIFEFTFLDANNILQTQQLGIAGGIIRKDILSASPVILTSGMEVGKCDFTILNDRLFIVNGFNYPKIYDGELVWEMGAPRAELSNLDGVLTGAYYYEFTFVTAGGEERLGTRSNTVSTTLKQIDLELPIGYAGTTSRKLYRTMAGGSAPKLLATIADNLTLTYTDNTADGSLGADIIAINNECPKPYFIETSYNQLIGAKMDITPTQIVIGDENIELWDSAVFRDIAGIGKDEDPKVVGVEQDYSKIIIATGGNIYVADFSGTTPTIDASRSNVGCKDGYSMVRVPRNGTFEGGVMFVSTLNDVRLFNGNFAQPVATSLDNLNTENFSQVIRETLKYYITLSSQFDAIFFDYKYHLIIDSVILSFDIRNQSWARYTIATATYSPTYNVFGLLNNALYAGQQGSSIFEQFYSGIQYRGEDASGFIQSLQVEASDQEKFFTNFFFFFIPSAGTTITLTITIDGDYNNPLSADIDLDGGAFDEQFFFDEDFETTQNNEDYRVFPINLFGKWIEFKIECTQGMFFFRGFKLTWDEVSNKEVPKNQA